MIDELNYARGAFGMGARGLSEKELMERAQRQAAMMQNAYAPLKQPIDGGVLVADPEPAQEKTHLKALPAPDER